MGGEKLKVRGCVCGDSIHCPLEYRWSEYYEHIALISVDDVREAITSLEDYDNVHVRGVFDALLDRLPGGGE